MDLAEIHDYYTMETIVSLNWLNGTSCVFCFISSNRRTRGGHENKQQIPLTPSAITIIKVIISYDVQLSCLLHSLTLP